MALVELTRNLQEHFPELPREVDLDARSVAEVMQKLDAVATGISFYLCDELGRLRQHVNVFVDGEMILDRQRLTDPLTASSRVFIAQALSGG